MIYGNYTIDSYITAAENGEVPGYSETYLCAWLLPNGTITAVRAHRDHCPNGYDERFVEGEIRLVVAPFDMCIELPKHHSTEAQRHSMVRIIEHFMSDRAVDMCFALDACWGEPIGRHYEWLNKREAIEFLSTLPVVTTV